MTGLEKQLTEKKMGHVGIGGAFRIVKGKIRAHIMPDFKARALSRSSNTCSPGVLCAAAQRDG